MLVEEALSVLVEEALSVLVEEGLSVLVEGSPMVEIDERMQPGHMSLPNGLGLAYPDANGREVITGIAPNELTALEDRDGFAGTPWHKFVPARLEPLRTAD